MAAKGEALFPASTSASDSPPPCSSGEGSGGGGASDSVAASQREPLEDVEMDAAQALADFAQIALLEREGHGGGGGGGRSGEEGLGRAEEAEESPSKRAKGAQAAWVTVVEKGVPEEGERWAVASSFPLHQQQTKEVEDHDQHKEGGECREDVKLDLGSSSAMYKPACRCSNRWARQNVSEAEKEARRMRRVLANRESARQTILRRKAQSEELVKKVAELSEENEIMKTEWEASMKEYLSLRDRNMQLKEQIARIPQQPTTERPARSSFVHGSGAGPAPRPEFAWPHILNPSHQASICREMGVPAAFPSASFQVPLQCPSCHRPVPFFNPAMGSVHPAAAAALRVGGEGVIGRGSGHELDERETTSTRMRYSTSSSSARGSEGRVEWAGCSSKAAELVAEESEEEGDDTYEVCGRGGTRPPASTLPVRPFDLVFGPAVAAPADSEPDKRALQLGSAAASTEARRRRRELRKLKHLRGGAATRTSSLCNF